MEITILELIENYGFNSVLLAVILFVLTGLIKKPLKMLAGKTADSAKYTRFITFLPLILGFGITALYEYLVSKAISIDGGFVRLWITSSSLSLAIYAFAEKFIPDKKRILTEAERKLNQSALERLSEYFSEGRIQVKPRSEGGCEGSPDRVSDCSDNTSNQSVPGETIVLRGKKHDASDEKSV